MSVGLEVFDDKGNQILGMNESVLRITKTFTNKKDLIQFLTDNPEKARYLLISSYVDLDRDRNTYIYTHNALLQQFLRFSDSAVLVEFNNPLTR